MIGKGGNSKVYLVERESKFYALKVVNIEMDYKLKENTLKEIRTLEDLKGMFGIIKLIDTQIDQDIIYILLEYGSTDLNKYIRKNTLSIYAILFFWEQMLKILKGLHARKYIHADVKPANFVIVDGNVRVIDFNISSKIRGDTTRLDLERPCGTLNYLAPEVLDSTKKERRRASDVWSLGIILYEMVYKKVPVDFNSQGDWLDKIQNIKIEEGEMKYKKILKMIRECLRRNPKERPTVSELLEELEQEWEG
ncbi:Dual specificity protein kinase Ttk [Nosema bombycis CQ1]|uniref:Dual specificity protein kinase Ttk n=1 Tax=Nosema bombycis (strain CQ1 / CVCC 102059) TaxID=578461 RepID=R0MMK8_NOSB1|nr:Dual specificity protein kinase Ttk [Nosema bombycis CQ1]|eukprot:EOB15440.1 Dual specificity protein kinase Ttk [Nosema bombycis CQ1]